jgi:hypothetical protein
MRPVNRLQATGAGCQWLLDQWAVLRALLERSVPWLPPDKLKAVRLLGQHPIDAIDSIEVAQVYLACHVLLNQEGDPFQEIMNELAPEEASVYASYLQHRRYDKLAPKDAAAARQWLLDLVDRTREPLRQNADVIRELAELDALSAADRLSWDDTAEGERLRRYELSYNRTQLRMFELLLKVRRTGDERDLGTIVSVGRSGPSGNMSANDLPRPAVTSVTTPPAEPVQEPDPPIEANSERENAPNEQSWRRAAPNPMKNRSHARMIVEGETFFQSNPILMFTRSVQHTGTGTKSSESIRRIWNAKLADSG